MIEDLCNLLYADKPYEREILISAIKFKEEILKETDRGMILFGVARLDILLKDLLEIKLCGSKNHVKELFAVNGPLGTFSSRINLTYSLGLISKSNKVELHILRSIRNLFAHSDSSIDLQSSEAIKLCNKLSYIIKISDQNNRTRIAFTVFLIYQFIRYQIGKCEKIKEKVDHFDEKGKALQNEFLKNL